MILLNYPDLYILRHGETVWNLQRRFQGRQDSPLTEHGKSQALQQRELLSTITNKPEKIYTSPSGRAIHTTSLAVGSEKEPVIDNRLQEIDFGEWEGLTRQDIKALIDYSFESKLWYFRSPGGETFTKISERVQSFLNDMSEPAIIVTHGVTSMVLRGLYMGLNQTEILKLPKDQGCIFQLSQGTQTILR